MEIALEAELGCAVLEVAVTCCCCTCKDLHENCNNQLLRPNLTFKRSFAFSVVLYLVRL